MEKEKFPDKNCIVCGDPIEKPNPKKCCTNLYSWAKRKYCTTTCRDKAYYGRYNQRNKSKNKTKRKLRCQPLYKQYNLQKLNRIIEQKIKEKRK